MSQSVNDAFATFPQVVCAHFHSHRMQTLDRLQGTGIIWNLEAKWVAEALEQYVL